MSKIEVRPEPSPEPSEERLAYRDAIKKTVEAEEFVTVAQIEVHDAKVELTKTEQNLRNAEFFLQQAKIQEDQAHKAYHQSREWQ